MEHLVAIDVFPFFLYTIIQMGSGLNEG